MIKLFSQTNKDAIKELKPDLGLRSWNNLPPDEKSKIWYYLERYFFNRDLSKKYSMMGEVTERYHEFYGDLKEYKQKAVHTAILYLNEAYKAKSYAENFLENPNLNSACLDFYNIFMNNNEEVVLELISAYGKALFLESENHEYVSKKEKEADEDFEKRKINAEYKMFDSFASRLNDVFEQFGVNYHLTRDGFVPRQDQKITQEIYEPVLKSLSDPKWKEANRELGDAFSEFQKKTPNGYSNCITHTVSALQAFLQILIHGETGKGDISKLIPEAQRKKLIPSDSFSTKIFKDIESVLMEQRQATSDAHPKKEYANQKTALLLLNL